MTRLAIVVVVASCTSTAKQPAAPSERDATRLEVIALDDYATKPSCDGVAPHRIAIELDGRAVGEITVPCATKIQAPPRQIAAPPIMVPAGKHRLRVREVTSGLVGERELELPVLVETADGETALATKLPIWANDDELELQDLRSQMTEL